MVVSMGKSVGDGKVVNGGAISSTMISDMVAFRKANIKDGRMTYGVVVSSAITFDIVALRRGDIGDDGEVTCGVVVSSRDSRDDGKLVDGGVVSSVITSNIVTFMAGNTGDGRVVSDTKYFKGEGLGESDGRGERESMEVSSANRVDVVDNVNMVSSECVDCRGCRPARPPPFPRPQISCILTIVANTYGLMDEFDYVDDSQTKHMQCSFPIM